MPKPRFMRLLLTSWCLLALALTPSLRAQDILIPMDDVQSDHLKAYGVTFWALEREVVVDWLLN